MTENFFETSPIETVLGKDRLKKSLAAKAVRESWTIEQIEIAEDYVDDRRNGIYKRPQIPIRGPIARNIHDNLKAM